MSCGGEEDGGEASTSFEEFASRLVSALVLANPVGASSGDEAIYGMNFQQGFVLLHTRRYRQRTAFTTI